MKPKHHQRESYHASATTMIEWIVILISLSICALLMMGIIP